MIIPSPVTLFIFLPHHAACRTSWPGIKPMIPAVEAWSPNHWTPRKAQSDPILDFLPGSLWPLVYNSLYLAGVKRHKRSNPMIPSFSGSSANSWLMAIEPFSWQTPSSIQNPCFFFILPSRVLCPHPQPRGSADLCQAFTSIFLPYCQTLLLSL